MSFNEIDGRSYLKKINHYWQQLRPQDPPRPFWEQSAYHVGNLAAYELTGDEDYLAYTANWCEANHWQGHPDQGPKDQWTWGYGEEQTPSALFADWHACYQIYLDVYRLTKADDPAMLAHCFEVMDYQVSTLDDSYWWWADGLFMGMSVMTKLYRLTEDVKYLDKLHEYFTFGLELMYDGEDGIPVTAAGYTSSAYYGGPYGGKQAVASNFSDPADYQHLFYRDGGFVFPAHPLPGDLAEVKNFWARGNGWVLASLARVLRELPQEWPHYHFYLKLFKEFAQAVKDCQKLDSEGRGFWTQSMLAHDFSCSEENPDGYETSGTAFFTFGLLAGINDGHLPKEDFLPVVAKAWRYLTEVATHEDGRLGYVQWVGGAAGKAATYENTQDFAVGAALLAAVEVDRFEGRLIDEKKTVVAGYGSDGSTSPDRP